MVFNVLPFLEKFLDIPILWRRDKYHFVSDKKKKSRIDCGMCLRRKNGCLQGQGKAVVISLEKGSFEISTERSVLKYLQNNLQLILYRENWLLLLLPISPEKEIVWLPMGPHSPVNSCAGFLMKRKTPDMMWFFLPIEAVKKSGDLKCGS